MMYDLPVFGAAVKLVENYDDNETLMMSVAIALNTCILLQMLLHFIHGIST